MEEFITTECGCVIAVVATVTTTGCCEMCASEEVSIETVRVVEHCAADKVT